MNASRFVLVEDGDKKTLVNVSKMALARRDPAPTDKAWITVTWGNGTESHFDGTPGEEVWRLFAGDEVVDFGYFRVNLADVARAQKHEGENGEESVTLTWAGGLKHVFDGGMDVPIWEAISKGAVDIS